MERDCRHDKQYQLLDKINQCFESEWRPTVSTNPPTPGIYYDVPFSEYLTWPHVNNSALSYAARSMSHYRYAPAMEPSDAMQFGSLVHCGQLEPAAIGARYAVMPDFAADIRKDDGSSYSNVRATKQYKDAVEAWTATIGDKEIITKEQLEQMLGVVGSIINHDTARAWLCSEGRTEVSIVWDDPDSGVRCKGRIDKLMSSTHRSMAVDLKTCRDGSEFEKSIARYAYHRQAAFYSDGISALLGHDVVFAFVVAEKEPPYVVRAATMADDAMDVGRREYKRLLSQLAYCRANNVWPGYDDPVEWRLPSWYATNAETEDIGITINGEVVA